MSAGWLIVTVLVLTTVFFLTVGYVVGGIADDTKRIRDLLEDAQEE